MQGGGICEAPNAYRTVPPEASFHCRPAPTMPPASYLAFPASPLRTA